MIKYLTTFFISMVPILELRGAIPWGVAWGVDPWITMLLCIAGNMIPVPFIIIFIRKIIHFLRTKSSRLDRILGRFMERINEKADTVTKYEQWGLFLFVAIPLPGMGAWTGATIAAVLDMRLKDAVPMILLGVCTAGLLVTLLTVGIIHL